jgi:hypothetical protein
VKRKRSRRRQSSNSSTTKTSKRPKTSRKPQTNKKNSERHVCWLCNRTYASLSNLNRHKCSGSKQHESKSESKQHESKLESKKRGSKRPNPSSNDLHCDRTKEIQTLRDKLVAAEHQVETVTLQTKLAYVEQALIDARSQSQTPTNHRPLTVR